MTGTTFTKNNLSTILSNQQTSVSTLERDVKTFQPLAQPSTIQELTFQFQGTSFTKMKAQGEARICTLDAPTTIDEETNAAVAAYATFDDIGGNGVATEIPSFELSDSFTAASFTLASFGSSTEAITYKIPLFDNEGRTAWYQANSKYLVWNPTLHPQVDHSKQFMSGHSLELNVPGIDTYDQRSYVYYDSHANFNMAANSSISLWFYPTDISQIGGFFFRALLQRYVTATTWFLISIASGGGDAGKILCEVNDAGVLRKVMSPGVVNVNAWNNIILTYNVSTDILTMYLNGTGPITSTYAGGTVNPWGGNTNMYIGGIPFSESERFTGFIDNFVFWVGKELTETEADNMWNHGTII